MTEALHLVVRERRIEREKGVKKNDMLAALFDSDGDEENFYDDEIVDFLVSLLVAGYDTTSTTMTLAVKYLTDTPSALAQLKVSYFRTFTLEHTLVKSKQVSSGQPFVPFSSVCLSSTNMSNIVDNNRILISSK